MKFTFDFPNTEATFLDTTVFKGRRFRETSILDIRTHTKKTDTFQYLHRSSCHPDSVFRGFIKGQTLRYLRTNSDPALLHEQLQLFKTRFLDRGYTAAEIDKTITDALKTSRDSALQKKAQI